MFANDLPEVLSIEIPAPAPKRARSRPRRRAARCRAETLEKRLLLANVPDGFTDETLVSGLDSPTSMEIAPDGRVFVAGQKGHLWSIENGTANLITTLSNVNSADERGLLGLVFDPNFASNGFLYVYYTRNNGTGTNNRVSRLTISNGTSIAESVVIDLPDTGGAIFHMGGALHFGTDGKLYVAVGDYQVGSNSQSMNTLAGKMLRLNPDGSIPDDNPFFNTASGVNRAIWALGLRNPFTFNIHPTTGMMLINDVGQTTWEEIDLGEPGANYGWPSSEGPDNTDGFTAPVYWYGHVLDEACSIGGGAFYRTANMAFPGEYHDKYFFADLCGGWVRALDTSSFTATEFATGLVTPVDLDVGPDGALYYLNRGQAITTGHVGRIAADQPDGVPVITQQPQNQSVAPGGTATFSVVATGPGTLNYQWQKDGGNIDGANAATLTITNVQSDDAGAYRVIVGNDNGSTTSSPATLAVISGTAPTAIIDAPTEGRKFRGGQTFRFSGRGTDPDEGELGADRLTWQVDYHTGSVVRPFFPATTGISTGTFTIPTETPFKATNVFYRVMLTATDSEGISTTTTRDIRPVVSRITLRSNVPNARVFTDGETRNTPVAFNAVAGIHRILSANPTETFEGITYVFDRWSDGGDRVHTISVPDDDTTYVARWRVAPTPVPIKGVTQTIFNNRNRTGTTVVRNVNAINFDWGEGSPHPTINPDTFFIRFRGKVQPAFTETYTFYTQADDGVRLFVNGQLLIDQWDDSGGEELSASIDLEAGFKYDLRFDYFENTGPAKAILLWESPSTPKAVVPRSALFTTVPDRVLAPTADAYVQGGSTAGDNFGDRSVLYVKNGGGNEQFQRDAYLKFDIRDIDPSLVGSAKLRFYGRLSQEIVAQTNIPIALYEAPGAKWGESSITYDNRPVTTAKAVGSAMISTGTNQFWEFDLTQFIRQQREAGRTIVTLALRNLDSSSAFTILHSRQANFNGPQLLVSV